MSKVVRIAWSMATVTFVRALPTLAITWPQGVLSEEDSQAGAAQVHRGVS